MDCAASCVWQDENGEEDVLAQAGKVRDFVRQYSFKSSGLCPPTLINLPLGESPANGGAKALTAAGGEGAQVSRFDVKTLLAGEIP